MTTEAACLTLSGIEPHNPWEAISAFIKSVRLRRAEDAILWLTCLWMTPKERNRIQQRVLYEAAEDGLSTSVIEKVCDWFGSPQRKSLEAAAAEVLRICSTANWWGQADGREYIYAWRRAELNAPDFKKVSMDGLYDIMRSAIENKELTRGLAAFNAVYGRRKELKPKALAELLLSWSAAYGGEQAQRLARAYAQHASTFYLDGNVSAQSYYAMIHGEFGEQVSPEISAEVVERILDQAMEQLRAGIPIPSFALDGVHTRGGGDRRFAGIVRYMSGCCRAYEHFGRLSPEDDWLPEFLSLPDEK